MTDDIDWPLTTFEGNRRAQQRRFMALSFRERLRQLEDMTEVLRVFGGAGREVRWSRGASSCGNARRRESVGV
jgi:hypothetical protein